MLDPGGVLCVSGFPRGGRKRGTGHRGPGAGEGTRGGADGREALRRSGRGAVVAPAPAEPVNAGSGDHGKTRARGRGRPAGNQRTLGAMGVDTSLIPASIPLYCHGGLRRDRRDRRERTEDRSGQTGSPGASQAAQNSREGAWRRISTPPANPTPASQVIGRGAKCAVR
jgi:hypothetical protein